jgi:hypothetical protein
VVLRADTDYPHEDVVILIAPSTVPRLIARLQHLQAQLS